MALKLAPAGAVVEVMQHLVADPNSRVRLIAAGSLLSQETINADAGAVLVEALADPSLRVREAALALFEIARSPRRCRAEALLKSHGVEPEQASGDDPAAAAAG